MKKKFSKKQSNLLFKGTRKRIPNSTKSQHEKVNNKIWSRNKNQDDIKYK